jgi:3-deoxy-D-manno-octulosonic-acid transferase
VTAQMAQSLGIQGKEPILIAGSTRPGEEEILLRLFNDLTQTTPHLILILAPRHLERLEEIERLLRKGKIPWVKRSQLPFDQDPPDQRVMEPHRIILLDTLGELMRIYSLGTLIFVGGSLVPIGGHNPLEPLFFKKCVLFGPFMFNFSEISQMLTEAGGAIQVQDEPDLSYQIKRLLQDERARKEVGERGYQILQRHRGATEKIFQEIRLFLDR